MGGFGVLTWLAIGAVGGWTISRLMVTAGDDALRGTAAGILGGILSGLGTQWLESSVPGANGVSVLLAALAGSLWLTLITCMVTSGRERRSRPRAPAVASFDVDTQPSLGNPVQTLAAQMRAS